MEIDVDVFIMWLEIDLCFKTKHSMVLEFSGISTGWNQYIFPVFNRYETINVKFNCSVTFLLI